MATQAPAVQPSAARTLPAAPPPWTLHGDGAGLIYRGGVLLFLRYLDSDVGAYDELLWLAPFQAGPSGRKHQVTRIYVSSELSAVRGRENWGLPKELAAFQVTSLAPHSDHVEVRQHDQHVASFTLNWSRRALPFDARILPARARALLQVSAGRCFETVPELRGRLHPARFADLSVNSRLLPGAHDSRSRLGFCLRSFELIVPVPRVWRSE